jgi:hypothetical protein
MCTLFGGGRYGTRPISAVAAPLVADEEGSAPVTVLAHIDGPSAWSPVVTVKPLRALGPYFSAPALLAHAHGAVCSSSRLSSCGCCVLSMLPGDVSVQRTLGCGASVQAREEAGGQSRPPAIPQLPLPPLA